MSISYIVKLRACDRCRFVFDMTEYNGNRNCPLCQFSTHSATIIHGERAKEFLRTQEPMQKRLLAAKREEAILQFERDVEHAATIKRNIVKTKLNIAGDNAPSNEGISLQDLAVMRGFMPFPVKPTSPVFHTANVLKVTSPIENSLALRNPASDYGVVTAASAKVTPSTLSLWEAVKKVWEGEKDAKKKE